MLATGRTWPRDGAGGAGRGGGSAVLAQCGLLCRPGRRLTLLPGTCSDTAVSMADTKTANISRMVIKQAGRAKEKVGTTAPAIAALVVISEMRL